MGDRRADESVGDAAARHDTGGRRQLDEGFGERKHRPHLQDARRALSCPADAGRKASVAIAWNGDHMGVPQHRAPPGAGAVRLHRSRLLPGRAVRPPVQAGRQNGVRPQGVRHREPRLQGQAGRSALESVGRLLLLPVLRRGRLQTEFRAAHKPRPRHWRRQLGDPLFETLREGCRRPWNSGR